VVLETTGEPVRSELMIDGPSATITLKSTLPVMAIKLDPDGNALMAGSPTTGTRTDPFRIRL
jgi:hypothetical protein